LYHSTQDSRAYRRTCIGSDEEEEGRPGGGYGRGEDVRVALALAVLHLLRLLPYTHRASVRHTHVRDGHTRASVRHTRVNVRHTRASVRHPRQDVRARCPSSLAPPAHFFLIVKSRPRVRRSGSPLPSRQGTGQQLNIYSCRQVHILDLDV
jgi:hypothetical protein